MYHRYNVFSGYDADEREERSVHPYLLDSLNAQHIQELRSAAAPRRSRRPLRRPATVRCAPVRRRSLAARLLHLHPAPSLAH